MKILNFGSINIDHVYKLPHLVREGETISSTTYCKNAGGKGLNQSIALARAGMETYHAGAVGRDGMFLIKVLQDAGVHTQFIQAIEEPTGHAMIQVDAAGHNAIVLYTGANGKIDEAMIRNVISSFEPGDVLLLQNEISGLNRLLELGAESGLRVVLNPSPITADLLKAPLELVDWLILNEIEGEELAGTREPEQMIVALKQRYPRAHVVLTLGAQGAIYAGEDGAVKQAAYPARAVDTTAAGDTFTGYLISGIMQGGGIRQALRYAALAAAMAVERPGASASIPKREEVEAALKERKLL